MEISFKPRAQRKNLRRWLMLTVVALAAAAEAPAQDGEAVFKQRCAACHTVGAGKLVGPDLKGLNSRRKEDWVTRFIKNPQKMIESGDADAKALYSQFNTYMPDQQVTDAEIKAILTFIGSKGDVVAASADTSKKADASAAVRSSDDATPAEIETGRLLFAGSQRFEAGGPSCISCHNVTNDGLIPGGLMAKDLTTVHARLGDAGISGMISVPPFPLMQDAYAERPLTEKEKYSLIAFFNKANKDLVYQHAAAGNPLLYWGVPLFAVFMLVIFVVWFNRKRHTVKKDILDRQIKSY